MNQYTAEVTAIIDKALHAQWVAALREAAKELRHREMALAAAIVDGIANKGREANNDQKHS